MSAKQCTNVSDTQVWYIAHNGTDIFHPGILEAGQQVETGQPYLEIFESEEDWTARKAELGVTE